MLFVSAVVAIISGLTISRVALPTAGISTIDDRRWRSLHNGSTTWMLIAVGLHIAMNWRSIVSALRRLSAGRANAVNGAARGARVARTLGRVAMIVLAAGLVGGVALAIEGRPSTAREVRGDDRVRDASRGWRGAGTG